MKKQILITLNIYQADLDSQNLEMTIYSELLPENENVITSEEIARGGIKKKIILDRPLVKDLESRFGRFYTYKISEEKLKELLNFDV